MTAAKLLSVLSPRTAIRLNSWSLQKKFAIKRLHLQTSISIVMELVDWISARSKLCSPAPAALLEPIYIESLTACNAPANQCPQVAPALLGGHGTALEVKRIEPGTQERRSAPIFGSLIHPGCDLWPSSKPPPFCTLSMPMHSHIRYICHDISHVRLFTQNIKERLKNVSLDPVAKLLEHGVPPAEYLLSTPLRINLQLYLNTMGSFEPIVHLSKHIESLHDCDVF